MAITTQMWRGTLLALIGLAVLFVDGAGPSRLRLRLHAAAARLRHPIPRVAE